MTTIEPSETGGPQRPPALAAWWAMTFAVTGAVLAVFAVVWHPPRSPSFDVLRAIEICAFLAFALLGALLVWRRPDHPVGWLLAALGVAVLVQQSAQQYALRGLAAPFQLHGWQLASWVAQWTIAPPLVLFVEVLLLFPAGRPNSRVQRVYVWGVGVAGVVLTIGWAAATWSQRGAALLTGGGALPGVLGTLRLALIASLLVAAGSLIWRFRYADPDERQQLKWLLLAGCGLMVAAAAGLITTALGTSSRLVDALGVVSIGGVAAAMTLAVLRYRLYEIDHILSRTVSYSLLTAILTALYTLGVVTVRAVLDPLSPDSGLAVAASTLLVAGAFTPLRTRIRLAVDRHFNRARYDAALAVEALRARMRDGLHLDSLQEDLVVAVVSTVQPATASVWLRPGRGDHHKSARRTDVR